MEIQVFNLEKYFHQTQFYYHFFDGLFALRCENKQLILNSLGIIPSSYRTQRAKEITNKSSIDKLLSYFGYDDVFECQKLEDEIFLSQIYYCCYYKQNTRLKGYLEIINQKIERNNVLKPIFSLFKILIVLTLEYKEQEMLDMICNDLEYIKLFYNKKYFKDDYEYLYLVILYRLDIINSEYELDELSLKYKKLSWLYYFIKGSKAYMKEEDNKALLNYQHVLSEFRITNNLERYFIAANNVAYLYNILGEYSLSYLLTSEVIEYVFSNIENKNRATNILMHYLFSNFMLGRYERIIEFVNIIIFDYNILNPLTAAICLIAASKIDCLDRVKGILELEYDDFNYNVVKEYIIVKDINILRKLQNYPYYRIIKENLL